MMLSHSKGSKLTVKERESALAYFMAKKACLHVAPSALTALLVPPQNKMDSQYNPKIIKDARERGKNILGGRIPSESSLMTSGQTQSEWRR